MEGFLVLLFDGQQREGGGAEDRWLVMLREVVRRSCGSVLVQSGCPGPRLPGRVLMVQPRHADDPVGPIASAAVWLGPLTRHDQFEALRGWLSAGGPGRVPLPIVLRRVRLALVPIAPMSPN